MAGSVDALPWLLAFAILTTVYFYSHYLFASNTAHIVAMYAVFLGGLAHYSSGPAGVIYGSGYVKTSELFRIGFVMSIVNIAIWTSVGGLWMKVLGVW